MKPNFEKMGIGETINYNGRAYTKRPNGSVSVATINNEPSMTQQQFKEETDVNNIIEKYAKTGELTHVKANAAAGVFLDVSTIPNFHEMQNTIAKAQQAFALVPAELRMELNNDPGKFIEWMNDENNNEKAIKYGVKVKAAEPNPDINSTLKELNTTLKNQKNDDKKTKQKNESKNDD